MFICVRDICSVEESLSVAGRLHDDWVFRCVTVLSRYGHWKLILSHLALAHFLTPLYPYRYPKPPH